MIAKMLLVLCLFGVVQSAPLFHFLPRAAFKLPAPHQYTWSYRTHPGLAPVPTISNQFPIIFPTIVRGHTAPLLQGPKAASLLRPAIIIPTRILSQVRSQDERGGYHFSYSGGPSSRTETRDHNGVVRGGYSYIDPNGQLQSYQYIADKGGYRVTGGAADPSIADKGGYRVTGGAADPSIAVTSGQMRAELQTPHLVVHRRAKSIDLTEKSEN